MKRKVVIPETEVKYVCELSEKDYSVVMNLGDHSILNPARDENATELTLVGNTFKKIETKEPLADDEVNVEEVSEDNIYAYKEEEEIYIYNFNKSIFFPITEYQPFKMDLNNFVKKYTTTTVYEFSGDNKQKEFFEWAIEQLNEHA